MIFEGHLSEEERLFLYEETVVDAEIEKGFAYLAQIEASHRAHELQAEARVLEERGTYDDLAYLYELANKDEQKSKEGIFATIINAIKNFFDKILSVFQSKKQKQILEEAQKQQSTKVSGGALLNAANHILNAFDAVKNFFVKVDLETGKKELNLARTALTATGTAVTIGGLLAIHPRLVEAAKWVREKLDKALPGLKEKRDIKAAAKEAKKKAQEEASAKASGNQSMSDKDKETCNVIKQIGSGIRSIATKIVNMIGQKLGFGAEKDSTAKNGDGSQQDQEGNSQDETSQQPDTTKNDNTKQENTSQSTNESVSEDDIDDFDMMLESAIEEDEYSSIDEFDTTVEDFFGESATTSEIDDDIANMFNELFG